MGVISAAIFDRPTVDVARELIGCYLAVKRHGRIERLIVTETEAYDGLEDLASHASRGKTKRNEIMFRQAGYIYVYFVYGMHWMLNVVTGPANYPAAVLIRGALTLDGSAHYDGPAKLTKAMGITGDLNGKKLSRETGLWVEASKPNAPTPVIAATPRIGVGYAGPVWSQAQYRFLVSGNPRLLLRP